MFIDNLAESIVQQQLRACGYHAGLDFTIEPVDKYKPKSLTGMVREWYDIGIGVASGAILGSAVKGGDINAAYLLGGVVMMLSSTLLPVLNIKEERPVGERVYYSQRAMRNFAAAFGAAWVYSGFDFWFNHPKEWLQQHVLTLSVFYVLVGALFGGLASFADSLGKASRRVTYLHGLEDKLR